MYAKKRPGTAHSLVGSQLAHFRRQAGFTQRELAHRMRASEETLASIEQGRRPLKLDTAEKLDDILDTRGALKVAVENMPESDRYPVWAIEFIDLEREALTLSWFENQVLPGLLQTGSYAAAVFRNEHPDPLRRGGRGTLHGTCQAPGCSAPQERGQRELRHL